MNQFISVKARDSDEAFNQDADMRATEAYASSKIKEILDKRKEDGKPLTGALAHEIKSLANSLKFYHDKVNRYEDDNQLKNDVPPTPAIVTSVMDSLKNLYDPNQGKE